MWVREEPAGAGPVVALRRGMMEVRKGWVVLLAADLPFVRAPHVDALLAAARGQAGAVLTDDSGRVQWLVGCWRADVLLAALAEYRGDSLQGLLGPLGPVLVPGVALVGQGEPEPWRDCDTPGQLAWARERYS